MKFFRKLIPLILSIRLHPTRAQQYAKCLDAWSGLVPANSSCYQVGNAAAGATRLSILFPRDNPSSNKSSSDEALRAISEAYVESMRLYGSFVRSYLDISMTVGPSEPFYITQLLGRTKIGKAGVCNVYINIIAFNTSVFSVDQGKAVVAHELYHCLQYYRHPSLADNEFQLFPSWLWRVEGAAAYMAASLYPDSDELVQTQLYDPMVSVFNQYGRYTAALFFVGLNISGIDDYSIDEWLNDFAELNSISQERLQLATDRNAGLFFIDFMKNYIDGEVPGARIPLPYEVTEIKLGNDTLAASQAMKVAVQSFAAARQQVIFDPAETVLMSMQAPPGVTISYRQVGMPWTNWTLDDNGPSSILQTPYSTCSGPDSGRLFDFLFINTGAVQNASTTLTFERAPGARPGNVVCACLLQRKNFSNCTGGFRENDEFRLSNVVRRNF